MVQAFDDSRPRGLLAPIGGGGGTRPAGSPPTISRPRSPLLGAMLLSRDAIAAAMEICKPERLLQVVPRAIFAAITSLFSQGEPADRVTVTEELRRRVRSRPSAIRRSSSRCRPTPLRRQRRVLRPDHRGAGPAAATDVSRRRDHRARLLLPDDVADCSTGPRAWSSRSPQRRVVDSHDAARGTCSGRASTISSSSTTGVSDHRPGHRLRRPRRAAGRPAAVDPHRRRRPPGHGQDEFRPGHGGPRRRSS